MLWCGNQCVYQAPRSHPTDPTCGASNMAGTYSSTVAAQPPPAPRHYVLQENRSSGCISGENNTPGVHPNPKGEEKEIIRTSSDPGCTNNHHSATCRTHMWGIGPIEAIRGPKRLRKGGQRLRGPRIEPEESGSWTEEGVDEGNYHCTGQRHREWLYMASLSDTN